MYNPQKGTEISLPPFDFHESALKASFHDLWTRCEFCFVQRWNCHLVLSREDTRAHYLVALQVSIVDFYFSGIEIDYRDNC